MLVSFEPVQGSGIDCYDVVSVLRQGDSDGRRSGDSHLLPAIGVKKMGPREARTIQIGNARLTRKATGVDTGFGLHSFLRYRP